MQANVNPTSPGGQGGGGGWFLIGQIRTVVSMLPEASVRPSGAKAIDTTAPRCPSSGESSLPVTTPTDESSGRRPRSEEGPVRGERDAVGPLTVSIPPATLLSRCHVPEGEKSAAAAGGMDAAGDGQNLAVGREGNRADPPQLALELADHRARRQVPEVHDALGSRGRDELAVGRDGDSENRLPGPLQPMPFFARGQVPHANAPVPASRDERLADGREGQSGDVFRVAPPLAHEFARVQVPKLDGAVQAPAGKQLATRRHGEGKRARILNWCFPPPEFFAGGRVPNADRPVWASRNHRSSIGQKSDESHLARMTGRRLNLVAGCGVPKADGGVQTRGQREIGGEDEPAALILPGRHAAKFLAGDNFPKAKRRLRARRAKGLTIQRKCEGIDRAAMSSELAQLLSSSHLPVLNHRSARGHRSQGRAVGRKSRGRDSLGQPFGPGQLLARRGIPEEEPAVGGQVATVRLSGRKAIGTVADASLSFSPNCRSSLPVATSQRRTVLSPLPETRFRPSGEKRTRPTVPSCPSKRRTSVPSARSYKRIVRSALYQAFAKSLFNSIAAE